MRPFPLHKSLGGLFISAMLGLPLVGQTQPAAPPAAPMATPQSVRQAWDDLFTDVIPQAPADPVLKVPQVPFSKRPVDDFENHFFFESKTEYIRSNIWFTGLPTAAGVINAPNTGVFNPAGVPYPQAFQNSGNAIYEFMNFGTRGWLSDRLTTNFSVRYRQDLTHVDEGSPFQSPISAFPSARRLELLTGEIEIHGEAGDGAFAHSALTIGRQNQYTTSIASFDGVTFTQQLNPRVTLSVFAGRRFTYYDDPQQRAIGGTDLVIKMPHSATLQYENQFYIRGQHKVTVRKSLTETLNASSSFEWVGGHPVDFSAQAFWFPRDGKTTMRVNFNQHLSDADFIFDSTYNARHLDTYDALTRLNLGPLTPYSQFLIDGHREVNRFVRVGGTIVVRRLTDDKDQAAFNDSFEDYRANIQFYPVRSLELFGEYHLRDTHRRSPVGAVAFDDVSIAGETREQDFRLEARRAFFKGGRLSLSAGGFYRSFDLQDRFYYLPNAITKGVVGSVNFRVDKHTRLYFNYSLDNDFYYFRPDIDRAQVLRIGATWKY